MSTMRARTLSGTSTHATPSGALVALGSGALAWSGFGFGLAGCESPPPSGSK